MSSKFPALEIYTPAVDAAARIAEIQCMAMSANTLLHRQFPSSESMTAFQEFLEKDAVTRLASANPGVMVARIPGSEEIMGFIKWSSPSRPEEKLETGDIQQVRGCRRDLLDHYVVLAEAAKKRSFGDKPCYQVSFVCVDPPFQGRGVGSLLMRKVMAMAKEEGLPVQLEATEEAVEMYRKLGFEVIDGFEMPMPAVPGGATEPSEVYRESCMVWYPTPTLEGEGLAGQ